MNEWKWNFASTHEDQPTKNNVECQPASDNQLTASQMENQQPNSENHGVNRDLYPNNDSDPGSEINDLLNKRVSESLQIRETPIHDTKRDLEFNPLNEAHGVETEPYRTSIPNLETQQPNKNDRDNASDSDSDYDAKAPDTPDTNPPASTHGNDDTVYTPRSTTPSPTHPSPQTHHPTTTTTTTASLATNLSTLESAQRKQEKSITLLQQLATQSVSASTSLKATLEARNKQIECLETTLFEYGTATAAMKQELLGVRAELEELKMRDEEREAVIGSLVQSVRNLSLMMSTTLAGME
ncbi:hypothetical protein P280DRAFT_518721 [Massarina eburnea CBS 473.64]|uniref:Uncharacterized protein n=1 Tax=Massarina eburnea CBS 473.64 TaxID=1395130 RepID=A0A6A6RXK8_9PLEO|nr:hypothetical protein P280DRAFT_518721 [Massarina eburnea CBS 473.64]